MPLIVSMTASVPSVRSALNHSVSGWIASMASLRHSASEIRRTRFPALSSPYYYSLILNFFDRKRGPAAAAIE